MEIAELCTPWTRFSIVCLHMLLHLLADHYVRVNPNIMNTVLFSARLHVEMCMGEIKSNCSIIN